MYISSIWPFSCPVVRHWSTKCGWARFADPGGDEDRKRYGDERDQRQQREMMNIITSTPTMVSSDVTIWLSVCCSVWEMLSMSFVTRLKDLAARAGGRSS